jgi:uncharacterized LabA/DUF88 family protein
MVRMADRNEYDVAYLLAADGDYTPAVEAVMGAGKKVFAASLEPGAQLAARCLQVHPAEARLAHGLLRRIDPSN